MISERRLEEAFPGKGRALRALLTGQTDPLSFPAVKAWADKCYHRPKAQECDEEAINVILEGHGTEALWSESGTKPVAVYINMGDTYAVTLLYNYQTSTWSITSYGDFVERNERRYHLGGS